MIEHGTEKAYRQQRCRCKICKKGNRQRKTQTWLNVPKLLIKPDEYKKDIDIKQNIHGYAYFYDMEHPICNSSGRVLVHRHEASKMLGRWVLPDEDVHHIDHNKLNNNWSNLEVITKSEHTLKHNLERGYSLRLELNCLICGDKFKQSYKEHKVCSVKCAAFASRKVDRPSKEELSKLIWEMPTTKIAKIYGVSDKAIEKWCKAYQIAKPHRGYWAKYDQTIRQNS